MCRLAPLVLLVATASVAQAQTRPIRIVPGPLRPALEAIRRDGGVDLVYASRSVEGKRTACRYAGRNARAALACALRGTGVEAVSTQGRQWVLRPQAVEAVEPMPPAPPPPPPPPRVTLAGFVSDAETAEVLPGAIVYLPERRVGAVTNVGGYVALPGLPMGPQRVQVSYVGYAPLDTVVMGGTQLAFRLRPVRIVTPELVVERSAGEVAAPSAGAIELSSSQLAAFPAPLGEQDVLRQVEWLPGVARAGTAAGGLLVRGGEPDENLYLLDGAPIYDPFHAFTLVSAFQSETVRNVQLYRGVFPADYAGRLSSVMAFTLRDGSLDAPSATVGVSPFAARFVVETPVTRELTFMAAARRSYLDKLVPRRHPVEQGGLRDTLRTGYVFDDLIARATYRPGRRHRLSATWYSGDDDLDLRLPLDASLSLSGLGGLLRPSDLLFDVRYRWGNALQTVRYEYLASSRLFGSVTAYRTGYHADEKAAVQPTTRSQVTSAYRLRIDEQGARAGLEWFGERGATVRSGVQASRRQFDAFLDSRLIAEGTATSLGSERSTDVALEAAVYSQALVPLSPVVRVQGGVRVHGFSKGGWLRILPNAGVEFDAVPGQLTLVAGAGRQVQFVHRLRDRASLLTDLVASRWIPASDSVGPAEGWMATAGFRTDAARGLRLSGQVYGRVASGVLLPRRTDPARAELAGAELGALLGQYVPAKARAAGLELTAEASEGSWSGYAAYTAETSERQPTGAAAYGGARFSVPQRLEGVVRRVRGPWTFALSGEVRSGFPEVVPTAAFRVGDGLGPPEIYLVRPDAYNGRLPTTARVDASAEASFRAFDAQWRTGVQLYNLVSLGNVLGRTYAPGLSGVRTEESRGLRFPLPLFEIAMTL